MFKDQIESISPKSSTESSVFYGRSDIDALKEFALQHAKDRPEKKVVDIRACYESQIDVEFFDYKNTRWYVNKIAEEYHVNNIFNAFKNRPFGQPVKCRPRMNHIHAWQGGDCPLPEGVEVKVWRRSATKPFLSQAINVNWCRGDMGPNHAENQIIAFEVIGLSDGYIWPWEVEDK